VTGPPLAGYFFTGLGLCGVGLFGGGVFPSLRPMIFLFPFPWRTFLVRLLVPDFCPEELYTP
jgi:hypothetical protein